MTDSSTARAFTAEDMPRLAAFAQEIAAFKTFVLNRFADYVRTREVTDRRGRQVEIADRFPRDASGYGCWRLADRDVLAVTDEFTIEHFLADDRGPGMVTCTVKMPVAFVFGDLEREERRQQFLALKAEFEPEG